MLVGCSESQQSPPSPETKPVEPVAEVSAQPSSPPVEAKPAEPVAEVATPEPPKAKAPDISIHEAANEGNIEAVKQHIAAGTNVNARHKSGGLTPLHYAVARGHKEVAELLITKGADVNAKSNTGWTPLHGAAWTGHKEIVELLIAEDADVNAKERTFSHTPLDSAIDFEEPEIADLLRKHGGKTGKELKAEGN